MMRSVNESKGQIERSARIYYRKFSSVYGASLSVDDLEQEFWMVWQKVNQAFDETRGTSFEAMLGVSIKHKAVELARKSQKRQCLSAVSLNETVDDGEEVELIQLVEGRSLSQESRVIRLETARRNLSSMDSRLRLMVNLLEDTSDIMKREEAALNAKAEYGRSIGIQCLPERGLTLTALTKLFGLSRCSRYRLLDQFKDRAEQ